MKNTEHKQIVPAEGTISKTANENVLSKYQTHDFPIVGIGASAGGLEAMEVFFKNMPQNSGMAFVVIQHLDPTHVGILPELLQRNTAMEVLQVTDRLKVLPDHIYVIPPNKSLTILNGVLHLFALIQNRWLRLPIDIFFRSLALDKLNKSAGIILSGMGSDGSIGIKSIKEQGGFALVQEPATAKFDSMPLHATEAILVDIVAPVEELPAKLIALFEHTVVIENESSIDSKNRTSLEKIIILLREETGHDFLLYKKTTLMRRIERRKGVHQLDSTQDYVRFLQENHNEVQLLFKELLIGVTSFFRDAGVWDKLRSTILPDLIKGLPDGYVLRAWVAACSTGEEAYSLAIAFKEVLESVGKHRNLTLQIFATDLDIDAIEKARRGFFTSNIVVDVSPEIISKFFNIEAGGYRVNSSIREMLIFAPHNVIKDPPFTKLNIVMCRNMLIYMEAPLQKKLIELFNYSLLQGGIMILGSAEAISHNNEGFEVLDTKLKFYKRTNISLSSELTDFPSSFSRSKTKNKEIINTSKVVENIQNLADQIVLQQFAPASVLVNDKGDIIYITGRTGKYLEPVAGKANWNIHAMARDGLSNELPNAFQRALRSTQPIELRNIKIRNNNGDFNCATITIKQIESPDQLKGMVLIVFKDEREIVPSHLSQQKNSKLSLSGRQKELESELQQSKEDLLNSREQMQASQEELKSINEELQSTNEELQSTNEELTTSKEEMQSLNEELQTVNAELQNKLSDFEQANNDMKNLLNSTEIATLFLDKELNIRRFTDPVMKIFKVRSGDAGRPFTDLVNDLNYPDMGRDALNVIKNLIPIQNTISTQDDRWYNVRIMPYRTLDDRIDGLVITFTDITVSKKAEETLLKENRYRRLFESAKDGILILNAETGNIIDVNPFLIEMLGYSYEQFVEKAIWEIGSLQDIVANKEKFSELKKKEFVRYANLPLQTADGKEIKVEFVSTMYLMNNKKVIQCIIRDITDRKRIEEALTFAEIRYHHLFESVKEGIFFVDAMTGKITDINPFLMQLLGYPKAEFVKKPIWDLNFLNNIITNKDAFKELKQENSVNYENVQIETANGQEINVDFAFNTYILDSRVVIQCFIRNFTNAHSK
jgi:two-component system CheB/CheR fusion protein